MSQASPDKTDRYSRPWVSHVKTPWNLALSIVALSWLFFFFAQRPLWHTDLWSHLQYGELIWSTTAIPLTEPIMPLAAGVPFTDTAWLSQVIAFGLYNIADVTGLQLLYATILTACFALQVFMCRRQGIAISWGAAAVMGWLNWHQFQVIRPQLAGVLCFVVLLALLTNRRVTRKMLWLIPLLMLLWANLHGSFVMGLVLVGGFCLGRAIDVYHRSRKISTIWQDILTRRLVGLLLLSSCAVMINPYGPKLYAYVLTFSQNPNLSDLTEWQMLSVWNSQGQAFVIIVTLWCMAAYFSPQRVCATELLLLAGLGGLTIWTSRMILWFAPVAAYYLALHVGAIWQRIGLRRWLPDASRRSVFATLVASLAMTLSLVMCIWNKAMPGGPDAVFRAAVSDQTPVAAAEVLLVQPPPGQIFNTFEWGDYLFWTAHRNQQDWKLFVASHAHLVPRAVWQDYMAVINVAPDWQVRLDRHDIKTVIVDKRYRGALIAHLHNAPAWRLRYEDDIAVIFVRD